MPWKRQQSIHARTFGQSSLSLEFSGKVPQKGSSSPSTPHQRSQPGQEICAAVFQSGSSTGGYNASAVPRPVRQGFNGLGM